MTVTMNDKNFSLKAKKMGKERQGELLEFCKNCNLHFKNLNLLDLAFHHRSFSNEKSEYKHYNNERLEFLGDSVLGLATAAFLYEDMADNPEGDLAKIKANVVSEKCLSVFALEKMHIDKYLVLGRGEELSGGRTKSAILADAVEAVIGALYLDRGYEEAERFVLKFIIPEIRNVQLNKGNRDYKSILQVYFQKLKKKSPVYNLVREDGPDHEKTFYVSVKLDNVTYGPAGGKSKKNAEQEAAKMACQRLNLL